jgi:hypothetical protein
MQAGWEEVMELVKAIGAGVLPVVSVESTPRRIGRGPENDLVLDDPAVSAQHAVVWVEGDRAWIRDGNSRNGTFVNGERVRVTRLAEGDRVRIGGIELVVRGVGVSDAARPRAWFVEDVDTGVRYPFRGTSFQLGSSSRADLRLPDGSEDDAEISVDEGELVLTGLEGERALAAGEAFTIGGRHLRVIEDDLDLSATCDLGPRTFDYGLRVAMQGFLGPVATLTDKSSGHTYQVDAEYRAVLLYILARARLAAKEAGDDDAAWCADDDVAKGIWGRKGAIDANSLHVLLYRVRKELKEHGFEPWFLEKRRRGIRLALTDVAID